MEHRYAHIPHLENGVAFSDPWYGEDVWCQYRKDFQDTNWFMKLESQLKEGEYSEQCFRLTFGRPTLVNSVRLEESEEELSVFSPMRYDVKAVELGIDTACIFCGSLKDFHDFGESIAFRTGADGMFGNLFVFTLKGETQPAGFVLDCGFDPHFMYEDKFFQHLLSSFAGKEISEKEFAAGISQNNLGNRMLLANELRTSSQQPEKNAPAKGPAPER